MKAFNMYATAKPIVESMQSFIAEQCMKANRSVKPDTDIKERRSEDGKRIKATA